MWLIACTIIFLVGIIIYLIYRLHLEKSYYEYKSSKLDTLQKTYDQDVSELSASVKSLNKTAYTNTVTGIGNLDYFLMEAPRYLERYPRNNFVLITFSIGNMPKINQLYGPAEGDRVLIYAGKLIRDMVLASSVLAHVQSNMFALLLWDTREEEIPHILESITDKLGEYTDNFIVTGKFGVYNIDDITQPLTDMLSCASLAQKQVKDDAVPNYKVFTEKMRKSFAENKKMCDEMEGALEAHKFLMYLQPMIDLHTYRITSAEALVRWEHPEKGLLSPYAFLPLFESTQLMLKLDYYMWEEACKTLRHWTDNKLDPLPVTLNISPVHLTGNSFIETLSELTAKYKIERQMLVLELPERGLVNTNTDVLSNIRELHDAGFTLCIDNFGSFHTPLNLLKDLPFAYVKLDRNFLTQNSSSEEGLTILRYLIAMAKELDLIVITEGVETLAQANFLTEIGCDTAQGYFFSKPIDLRDFDQLNKKLRRSGYHPNEYYPTFTDMDKGVDIMEQMLH